MFGDETSASHSRDQDLMARIHRMGTDPEGYFADARAAALPAARARAERDIKAAQTAARTRKPKI